MRASRQRWRWMMHRLGPCLGGLCLAASCDDRGAASSSDAAPSGSTVTVSAPPPPPDAREGVATIVTDRASVPLQGERVEAIRGDWLLQTNDTAAVISAEDGRVIDFGPKGGIDGLGYVDSLVWDGLDRTHDEVVAIEAIGTAGQAVHVTKRVPDKKLLLHIWYWLDAAKLQVDSLIINEGPKRAVGVTLGEIFRWGNTPTWVEGHGPIDRAGAFGGDFIARQSHGIAYAAASLDGPLMARFGSPDLPGFHPAAKTGESPITLEPGATSARRRIAITTSTVSIGEAVARLPTSRAGAPTAVPEGAPREGALEVAHCEPPIEALSTLEPDVPKAAPPSSPPAAPSLPDAGAKTKAAEVKRPDGASRKASEPPAMHAPFARYATTEKQIALPDGCFVARFVAPGWSPGPWLPTRELASHGAAALPKRGTFGWAVTEKGAAVPTKIVVRGRAGTPDPDWGDDGIGGLAINGIYSPNGAGSAPIPPGRYHVFIGRGPEYNLHEEDIQVDEGKSVTVEAKLERVVDTSGWISADLHVHAIPSFDAPVLLADRARSLAGAGVEVGVATDHNRITDYAPAIAEAGLKGQLASVVGDEITSQEVDFGHFNAFPLRIDAETPPTRSVPPHELFVAMRGAAAKGGPIVVQVNHPRMGDIGYFELLRLDPEDIAGSVRRSPLFDEDFDALEVFNGDHYADIPKVDRAMTDWYALLAAGKHVTATGNSDSHKVTYQEAGIPRNWVRVPDDDPAHFDERAFIDSIRAGRVIVSSGPFIDMTVGKASIGDRVSAGDVEVHIRVEAPAWIDVARVELIDKGRLVRVFEGPFQGAGKRFDQTFTQHVDKGDFLVAVVRGDAPMEWLSREKAKPFGFTNPIWVE